MTTLVGTGGLIRLILRRDRFIMLAWVLAVTALVVGFASSFIKLYSDPAAGAAFADLMRANPASTAVLGPVRESTVGGLTAWRTGVVAPSIAAIASMFTVLRHTRTEEEAGRRELLGSTVVGRHAGLTAALIVTLAADAALALIAALGLMALGLPPVGSLAIGLAILVTAWPITALAGVAAQLTESARSAKGIVGAIFGATFVLRAVADSAGETNTALYWLRWLSPIGWSQHLRAFAGENWWIIGLAVVVSAILIVGAYALSARRDVDAGLLPARLGPPEAPAGLRGPLSLAWRMHRGMLVGWVAGFVVVGAALGAAAVTAADLLVDNPQTSKYLPALGGPAGATLGLLGTVFLVFSQVITAYGIATVLRLRSEETSLRIEPILATPVDRLRVASSHLFFAAIGPALILAGLGLASGITYGLSTDDFGGNLTKVFGGAMLYVLPVWTVTGLAVLLFGFLPRIANIASWVVLAIFLAMDLAGETGQISQGTLRISPYWQTPRLLVGESLNVGSVIGLLVISAALAVVGVIGFRRRDIG